MAVLITFPDGSDWYVTNIGFGELVQNYAILFPDDAEMRHELEMIGAVGGIVLGERESVLMKKVLDALENVVERALVLLPSEQTVLVPKDRDEQQDHLVILRKLLPLVKTAKASLVSGRS